MGFRGDMYIWKDRKRFLGMPLSFTRYALSEDRLFFSVGLFSVQDEELLLYRVRDISVTRSLGQRLSHVGSITIRSSDKSTPVLVLKNIKKPIQVKELIHENVEVCKTRRRMHFSEMMGDVHNDDDDDLDDIPDVD